MADLLALSLDPATARHLVRALDEHARWCRSNGHRVPPGLADLALLVRKGQERTFRDSAEDFADDGPMTPLVLTFAECAEQLRVSERHVRRLVDAGLLRPVEVGERKRRIARQDLENYIAGLRAPVDVR